MGNLIWNSDEPPSQSSFPQLYMTQNLTDLWNFINNGRSYLISPVPQISALHKYIIMVTDGVSNVLNPQECVELTHMIMYL